MSECLKVLMIGCPQVLMSPRQKVVKSRHKQVHKDVLSSPLNLQKQLHVTPATCPRPPTPTNRYMGHPPVMIEIADTGTP